MPPTKLSWLTKVPCRKWQSARSYLRLNTKLISLEVQYFSQRYRVETVNSWSIGRASTVKSRGQADMLRSIDLHGYRVPYELHNSSFKWAFLAASRNREEVTNTTEWFRRYFPREYYLHSYRNILAIHRGQSPLPRQPRGITIEAWELSRSFHAIIASDLFRWI